MSGKLVGDALVAVDAGALAGEEEALVGLDGALALAGDVHRLGRVAVAALERVVGLEPRPFVLRELEPVVEELLARVDRAEDLAPDLLGGLHLAGDLVGPVVRHVAVGTGRAHPRAVGVVDRRLHLLEDVVAHLVAAGAEGLGVGQLERGVEAAPEDDAHHEAAEGQEPEAVVHARTADRRPGAGDEAPHQGVPCWITVSTSSKPLPTIG